MKQSLDYAKKVAEKHLDEMMASINPAIGFSIGPDNVAYLADLKNQRLILDREPSDAERACLLAYSMELQLRTSDQLEFELDGSLYHRDREKGEYRRYYLDGTSWKSETLSLLDFIKIQEFAQKDTISEADRAARSREDWKRLEDTAMKMPGKVKEE